MPLFRISLYFRGFLLPLEPSYAVSTMAMAAGRASGLTAKGPIPALTALPRVNLQVLAVHAWQGGFIREGLFVVVVVAVVK